MYFCILNVLRRQVINRSETKREWVTEGNTMGNRDMRGSHFVQDFHSVPVEKHRWNSTKKKIIKTTDSTLCTLLFEVIRDSQPGTCFFLTFYNLFIISTSQQLPSFSISLYYRQFLFLISICITLQHYLSYIIDLQMTQFWNQSFLIIIYNIKTSIAESDL